MLNQPFVLRALVNERQNELLKQAEANRIARQVKKKRRVPVAQLTRVAARLGTLLMDPVRQLADQSPFFLDEAFMDSYR